MHPSIQLFAVFTSLRRSLVFIGVCLAGFSTGAATIPVFNTNDSFAGSLRQAIQDAPPDSTIIFQIPTTDPGYDAILGRYVISLTSARLLITKSLTIDAGAQKITIQRSFAGGTPNFQIFRIESGTTVTLANLAITNGNASASMEGGGAAIYSNAALTLKNCAIYSNTGGGLGALYSVSGSLTISRCTVTNNTAFQVGAIENFGTPGTLAIDNSTFSLNGSQNSSTGAIRNQSSTPAQIRNTIVVGNTGNNGAIASDVTGSYASGGYNLIGTTSGSTGFGATGDQLGVTPAIANLGQLQDNGGPTLTMRPRSGSVAIDQGRRGLDANNQPINSDQRGSPRPVDLPAIPNAIGGDGSDIGAVETAAMQSGPTFTVTNTDEHTDGACTDDDCTLVEALNATNSNADVNTINFAPGLHGSISTLLNPPGLAITNPVTINGPGARALTINGRSSSRLFFVPSNSVYISGLTMENGSAGPPGGAGFYVGGSLTLTDCIISSHITSGNGAGLYIASGATLTLNRSTLYSNNTSGSGGAIYSEGIVTATNCTFSDNRAFNGGGIFSAANSGNSRMTLRNCTVTGCLARDTATATGSGGGGIYAVGASTQYHLGNTVIAGNTSFSSPQTNPDVRGNFTSDGHNFIGNLGNSTLVTTGVTGDQIGTIRDAEKPDARRPRRQRWPDVYSCAARRQHGD